MITSNLSGTYIANIIKIAQIDGKLHPKEQAALEKICENLATDKKVIEASIKMVANGDYTPLPVGRFSDKVRNLEDMLYVALVDGELSKVEKEEMLTFAKKVNITQDQLKIILTETKIKIDLHMVALECRNCGSTLASETKFCTVCGTKV
jgi:uncharacterized tellurite resistance protein B-like protein